MKAIMDEHNKVRIWKKSDKDIDHWSLYNTYEYEREKENDNIILEDGDAGDCNLKVCVKNMLNGSEYTFMLGSKSKVTEIKFKIQRASNLAPAQQKLICNGKILDDNIFVNKLPVKGDVIHVLLATVANMKYTWNEDKKFAALVISNNNKSITGPSTSGGVPNAYCNELHSAVTNESIPFNSIQDFTVQLVGPDLGCYDAIGVVTKDFDPEVDKLGDTNSSWSIHMYPGGGPASNLSGCHHDHVYTECFWEFKNRGVTTLRVSQSDGTVELLFNGESKGVLFSNLPRTGTTLYFAGRVCGHDGRTKLTIIDDLKDISIPSEGEEIPLFGEDEW